MHRQCTSLWHMYRKNKQVGRRLKSRNRWMDRDKQRKVQKYEEASDVEPEEQLLDLFRQNQYGIWVFASAFSGIAILKWISRVASSWVFTNTRFPEKSILFHKFLSWIGFVSAQGRQSDWWPEELDSDGRFNVSCMRGFRQRWHHPTITSRFNSNRWLTCQKAAPSVCHHHRYTCALAAKVGGIQTSIRALEAKEMRSGACVGDPGIRAVGKCIVKASFWCRRRQMSTRFCLCG